MKVSKIVIGKGSIDTHVFDENGKEIGGITALELRADINEILVTLKLEMMAEGIEIVIPKGLEAEQIPAKVPVYQLGSNMPQKYIRTTGEG